MKTFNLFLVHHLLSGCIKHFRHIVIIKKTRYSNHSKQDYQIIATRSTKGNDKKDQLFVIASDKRTFIFPIDIRRVPAAIDSDEGPDWDTKIKGTPISMTTSKPDLVGRSYGEGLQLRLMDDLFPGELRCGKLLSWNVMDFQKNYHVFDMREPDSNGNGTMGAYMEMQPHGWRITRKVNFYTDKFHKFDDWQLFQFESFDTCV